jgi:hypothetical protein
MEQRLIKSAIEKHGPDKLRAAFELCFDEYTPTREYPILTAGFALSYMVNRIMPRINKAAADQARETAAVQTQQQIPDEWW